MKAPRATVVICVNCYDYAEESAILKPHGSGWRHVSNNSVRCPGQEDDETDDRAMPRRVLADIESSASSQFFIDTGHYLPVGIETLDYMPIGTL